MKVTVVGSHLCPDTIYALNKLVEAGMEIAEREAGVVQHYVIANPTEDCEKMLKISCLDKR